MNQTRKTIQDYRQEEEKAKKDLKIAKQDLKIAQHQMKKLTRKERTHLLCTRGGMLNQHLLHPYILEDSDVERILDEVFSFPESREFLRKVLQEARDRVTPS